ncbi:hypothetical protein [Leptospira jelokensis]|uniref:hypothetical protein n=1 Tax=Leptospira jelokensis TaxID=2484931 RepID=UPI00109146C4|nr:hypothetical protein [Leptospira jelokensis]TGM02222.1 hypothetical protein EHQ79_12655 [Leptospira jelokensis]
MKTIQFLMIPFPPFRFLIYISGFLFVFSLLAKEPPNQITYTEGGVQKTFYRNPNLEAEFISLNQINSSQNKSYANQKLKVGWNIRKPGKALVANQTKSGNETKVTEVYNTGQGYGPNIVLPGMIVVSFRTDQSKEFISELAKRYKIQIFHTFNPRLVSFQTEPGYLSVEKANELVNEPSVAEAYPETAVEKVLK